MRNAGQLSENVSVNNRSLWIASALICGFLLSHSARLFAESRTAPPLSQRELIVLDDATLNDVCFVGSQVGYAVGDRGCIRKTIDGGETWTFLPAPVACQWESVLFLTDKIGWIAGGVLSADGKTSQGCLLKTVDGGESWEIQAPSEMGYLTGMQFFGLKQGVVCGESTTGNPAGVWITEDGGKTWLPVPSVADYRWLGGTFTALDSGVLFGEEGTVGLLGGNSLQVDPRFNLGARGVTDVVLDSSAAGWLVGDGGLLRYSPGGAAWQDPPSEIPSGLERVVDLRTVAMRKDQVWLAGHPGSTILHSSDGGKSWDTIATPATAPLNAIQMVDEQTGFAVGELGTILKTDDGGQSWVYSASPGRRLALLQFAATPEEVSLSLSARYAGHGGYRTGAVALCRRESTRNADQTSTRLRLEAGQLLAGGNISRLDWTLPLDLPELRGHQQELISRWERATDGQLSETVLARLVRDLRAYRPTVLVVDKPAKEDEVGELVLQAVENAVRIAGDPNSMPEMKRQANLPAWQVPRLVLRNRSGQGGDIVLDNNDYLKGLRQSVRSAASSAYHLVDSSRSAGPLFESYSISDITPVSPNLRMQDLFTGIVIGPGSAARRRFMDTQGDHEAGEKLAQRQRNQSAYLKTQLHDPQKAGRTIAQLDKFVAGMSPGQAATQMYEIAGEYRDKREWDFYESVLMKLIEDHPQQPLAGSAAVELIQLWCSAEMRRLRLRNRGSSIVRQEVDEEKFREDLQDIRPASAEVTGEQPDPIIPSIRTTEQEAPRTQGTINERKNWEATWQQRARSLWSFLEEQHPHLARTTAVQFPMASLLRHSGSLRGANDVYRPYLTESLNQQVRKNARSRIAETEFWLQSGQGIPPELYSVSGWAKTPPRLDAELSEKCWQQATELRLQSTIGNPQLMNADAAETPLVMVAHDRDYFYLAASFPRVEGLPEDLPPGGGRYYDQNLEGYDRLQFTIDVDRDYYSSYQFEVDQRGYTRDSCASDPSWNPEWYVACEGDAEQWRVEIAIPRAELEGEQRNAEPVWAVGLTRILPARGVQSWSGQTTREQEFGATGWIQLKRK